MPNNLRCEKWNGPLQSNQSMLGNILNFAFERDWQGEKTVKNSQLWHNSKIKSQKLEWNSWVKILLTHYTML